MTDGATEIILVRHGQTEWNRIERFRGRADIPLNETGLRQAQAVATRLAAQGAVAKVYSSPLERCTQTAKVIAGAVGGELRPVDALVDIHYGDWQGATPDEVEKRHPALYRQWLNAPEKTVIPGGETLAQVRARTFSALDEAVANHPGKRIVFVSHKVVCKVLLCAVLGLGNVHFWRIEQDNAAINIFERCAGRYVIKLVNDTCHLRGLASPG